MWASLAPKGAKKHARGGDEDKAQKVGVAEAEGRQIVLAQPGQDKAYGTRYPDDQTDRRRRRSDIEIDDLERVALDEVAARIDNVAHERAEDLVGLVGMIDPHLEKDPPVGVERRLPELLGVHLAQALVALDRETLATRLRGPPRRGRSGRR